MKKVFTILLFLMALLTLAGCGGKKTAEYRTELQSVTDKMYENASVAEGILNQYANVWSYSIKSRSAIPVADMSAQTGLEQEVVREYFKINNAGNISSDFSTNIHALNNYYDASGELSKIKTASDEIKSKITELNDPPEGYKEVYNEVLDLYNLSEEYVGMALNPDGSLQSFNDSRNQLTNDIVSKYKRIEVLMPSEK